MSRISLLIKKSIVFCIIISFLIILLEIASALSYSAPLFLIESPFRFIWIIFAFASGLLMMGSRAVYPVALNISFNASKRNSSSTTKRIVIFSIATFTTLVLFGILFPSITRLPFFDIFDFSKITSYLYILFGVVAYLISMGNLNVISLSGVVLIKNIKDLLANSKDIYGIFTFVLFAFFSEIVPSTWLIFLDSGLGQNIKYGLILLASHAIGRIFLVLMISIVSKFGLNATDWLIERKKSFRNALDILTLVFCSVIIQIGILDTFYISSSTPSIFRYLIGSGIFFLTLLILPLWIKFFREERRVYGNSEGDIHSIRLKIKDIEDETRNLEILNKKSEPGILRYISKLAKKLEELSYISKILESSLRHGHKKSIRTDDAFKTEEKRLKIRLIKTILLTLLLVSLMALIA